MKTSHKTNLYLASQLASDIREDWNDPRNSAVRSGAYSEDGFQKRLRLNHKQVGTNSLFKTVKRYMAEDDIETNKHGVEEVKIVYLVKFIYEDHADFEWPRVTKTLRTYAGGEYENLVLKYLPARNSRAVAEMIDSGHVRDTPAPEAEKSLYLNLINLAIEAKTIAESQDNRIQTLEHQNNELERDYSGLAAAMDKLRQKISQLEYVMEHAKSVPGEVREGYQRLLKVVKDANELLL